MKRLRVFPTAFLVVALAILQTGTLPVAGQVQSEALAAHSTTPPDSLLTRTPQELPAMSARATGSFGQDPRLPMHGSDAVSPVFLPSDANADRAEPGAGSASGAVISDNGSWLGSPSLTVHATVVGTTTVYIGATEAAGFWIEDLTDLGINTYRLWTKMNELEWWDDDDAMDADPWNDNRYGTPTITETRADASSGFSNTVPWEWWDQRFEEDQSWRYGVQTRQGIIEGLIEQGITPVIVLRTIDDQGNPDYWPGVRWAPKPPVDEAFRNEWWEHCFAIAYWLNVRHDYGVTHFEVLNEPDWPGQGWQEYGGSEADYVQLVLLAHDAVSYANSFAGLPVYLHAPVVANFNSPYVTSVLDNADEAVQVIDYHDYSTDVRPGIIALRGTINSHNPDGILEPVWNSEWGALWSSYDDFDRAMTTTHQLLTFSEEQVEGVTLFNMYDWSTTPGQDFGLIDLQDDGQGGAQRSPTESYYAFRLVTRGLIGGKALLQITANGLNPNARTMASRDGDNLYIILLQDGVGTTETVSVDLSELGIGTGTASLYEYSSTYKDQIVDSPTIVAGHLTFTAPADGVSLVVAPLPNLHASKKIVNVTAAPPGRPLTYTLVLTNSTSAGPAAARLTDTLPAGLEWAGRLTATSGAAGYDDGVITWTGAITPGTAVTVTFPVTLSWQPAGTDIRNTALLDDGIGPPFPVGPVTTTVSQVAGIQMGPNCAGSVAPDTVVTCTYTLTNTGNGPDTFTVTHTSSQGWPVAYQTPIALDSGQTTTLIVSLTVPASVISGTVDSTVLTVTSWVDPSVRAGVHLTSTVVRRRWIIYLPLVLNQGSPASDRPLSPGSQAYSQSPNWLLGAVRKQSQVHLRRGTAP